MCGRFSLYEPVEDLVERFSIGEVTLAEMPPRWNVAPSQDIAAVAASQGSTTRRLGTLRWGLVPRWAKDPSIGNRLINARAETVSERSAFRDAFRHRRCLVPVSGFFEWQSTKVPGGRRPVRRPYHATAAGGAPLALAGLWEIWHDSAGVPLRTCTIITTRSNAVLAPVHDRMPVILAPDRWDRWLSSEPLDADEQEDLLAPASEDLLVLVPVSDQVSSARNDGPDLVMPVVR